MNVCNDILCILGGKDEALKSKTIFHTYTPNENKWSGFTTNDIIEDDDFDYGNETDNKTTTSTKNLTKKGTSRERSRKR